MQAALKGKTKKKNTSSAKSKMHVPLIKADLPPLKEVQGAFKEILENGRITNFGKYVQQFEAETARFLGAQTVTTSSGTMGLIFALQALGVKKGDKVVLPSLTFMATVQAVLYVGAVPVFCDIDDDLNLSPSDFQKVLKENSNVAAVIPVHLYGLTCKTDEIQKIAAEGSAAQSRKIRVLYDAAHAFGASRNGRRVGSFGDAEVFSLSVTKALTTVEGGLIASRDPELIEAVRTMRNYGMVPGSYNSTLPGLNGKMSEFHAIVGVANLKRLPKVISTRKKSADYFSKQIVKKTPFAFMQVPGNVVHTYKDFTIIVPEKMKSSRDKIMAFLRENGVETRAYFFPPAHEQALFKQYHVRPLPKTEDLSRRVITLPFFTTLSKAEIDYMVQMLVKAAEVFA